jgi:hypothetical protein
MVITLWSSPVEGWTALNTASPFHPIKKVIKLFFPSSLMKRRKEENQLLTEC